MIYRRRFGSDAWHWIRECSWWPRRGGEERLGSNRPGIPLRGFKEQEKKPTTFEFCDECLAKARKAAR